jgi:murein peptide amidase A
MARVLTLLAAFAAASTALAAAGAGDGPRGFGESVQDRDLRAINVGVGDRRHRVLVVGSIHGDEREGHEVIRRLRRKRPETGLALWTVKTMNPDGVDAKRRVNARGVDLNRNFPYRWRSSEPPGAAITRVPGPRPSPRRARRCGSSATSGRT